MSDRVRSRISDKVALSRVQTARQAQAETEQIVRQNEQVIGADVAREVLREREAATRVITQQAEEQLRATNSHIQAIPSAPIDPADNTPLIDRAVAQERQRRETLAAIGPPVIVPPPPPPPGIPPVPEAPPPVVPPPPVPPPAEAANLPAPPPELPLPPPATPTVAPGPTPTGSGPTNPQDVSQRAASDTARETPAGTARATPTGASAAATESAQLGPLRLQFEPNIHNEYDRVAYVFKLCMISDLDAEDPGLLTKFLNNQTRKIVIAESGVTTGFAIGDVEITDSISANFRNRSNMTTGLKIQIIEPYGLTLPDKMFQASQLLGIRNWRLAPFLLQLEFRYIKSDGSIYAPTGSQKLVRVYQLIVTDFDAQLKETGTIYDVQANVRGNLGFTDAYQIMPQSHRIDTQQGTAPPREFGISLGDNKVSSFFTQLGRTITDMYVQLRQNNNRGTRLPVLIYKFIVMDEELGKQEINFSPEANSRRASFKTGNANTGEITVSRGQSVTALVDDIMATIKDPEFFFQGLEQGGLIKIPVIECVTKNVGWDLLTNDYVREFTFFIRTKLSNRPVPNEEYGSAIQGNENLQLARLREVSKNLKKRYDYYYTGLNTEVISCDIKFNQLHVVPQSLLNVTLPMSVASAARVNPNNADPNAIPATELNQQLTQRQRELERNALTLNNLGNDRNVSEETLGQQLAELTAERTSIQQRIEAISRESVVPFEGNQEAVNRLAPITNRSAQAEQLRRDIRTAIERNNQQAGRREFAEDINTPIVNNMLQLSYHADPRDILNTMARPVNIESGGDANNTPNTTRPIVSSILQQIYDKSGQHLIEIDLEIRGDPYWLGTTDLERTQELLKFLNDIQGATPGTDATPATQTPAMNRAGMVDKHNQDANILLKFRSGVPPQTNTGFMNLKDDSTFFYGVYTVIECIHEFKSGKFTQKLKAYRDALINIDMLRTAERNAVSASQPQQVTAATPTNTQATGEPGAGAGGATNAQLTNPNASAANIQRSQDATNVAVTPSANGASITGLSRQAQINADNENLLAQTRNEAFVGGRGRIPDSGADITGERTLRDVDITGERGLRDPAGSSLYQPRVLPNTRQATYDAATDTFGNTSVGPGETVDYSNASLQALSTRRNSR